MNIRSSSGEPLTQKTKVYIFVSLIILSLSIMFGLMYGVKPSDRNGKKEKGDKGEKREEVIYPSSVTSE